jgi:Carboxypeptidase regulatory-like domain
LTRSQSAFVPLPLLLILLASQNLAADPGCIRGKVLDVAGAPVPSIHVIATSANRKMSVELQTDTHGFFMLDQALAGEEYEVLASDNPVNPNDSSAIKTVGAVQAIAGTENHCPSLMILQPARAHLRVKATDMFTGEPVRSIQAHFQFDSEKPWRGGVDEHGELLVPPDSSFEVQIGAAGYENSEVLKMASPQPGDTFDVALELRPVQTGCIAGAALNLEGIGVSGAGIQMSSEGETFNMGASTSTDLKGQFRISGVQPGNYAIFVTAAGYPPSGTQSGMMTEVAVPAGADCADEMIRLGPKAAKLKVKVINGMTQEPIRGAEVWIRGDFEDQGGWSLTVSGDLFPVPAQTQITVSAGAEGFVRSQPLTISPMQAGQTREIMIELTQKSSR